MIVIKIPQSNLTLLVVSDSAEEQGLEKESENEKPVGFNREWNKANGENTDEETEVDSTEKVRQVDTK